MEFVKIFLSKFSRCPFVKIFPCQNFAPYGTVLIRRKFTLASLAPSSARTRTRTRNASRAKLLVRVLLVKGWILQALLVVALELRVLLSRPYSRLARQGFYSTQARVSSLHTHLRSSVLVTQVNTYSSVCLFVSESLSNAVMIHH